MFHLLQFCWRPCPNMVEINATPCADEGSETADYLDMEPDDVSSVSAVKDQARDGDDVIYDEEECNVKSRFVEDDAKGLNACDLDPEVRNVSMETPMPDRPKPPDGGTVLSRVCLRWSLFSSLSFMQYVELCAISWNVLVMRMFLFDFVIILKLDYCAVVRVIFAESQWCEALKFCDVSLRRWWC